MIKNNYIKNQKGFTLVEIAIVLVIVGLLIGGILQGRSMIKNAKVKRLVNDIEGIRSIDFGHDFRSAVNIMMSTFNAIIGLFLLFSCGLAALAIFTTIYVNFQERQREIATMLTLGISDNEFLLMMTIENVIQAICGIIIGIPMGIFVSNWLLDNILRTFYFEIIIQPGTWVVLWIGILTVVLISQIPAIYKGLKLDLPIVTKELAS